MGQFLAKPTRFAFIILTTCVVPVISFGDDGMQLHTPSIPTKTLPASSTCPMWGSVAAYQPTWHERQSLIVRVQFTNAGDAAQVFSATLYYDYPNAPICTFDSTSGISCAGTHLSQTSTSSPVLNNARNWVNLTFTPTVWGSSISDGTGKGIIIITKNDSHRSQYLASNVLLLEYPH